MSTTSNPVAQRPAAVLDELVASRTVPGASVLVLRDGEEVLYHHAGVRDVETALPMSRDVVFRLFSMTKPVTATALMILVDEGVVDLDDPLAHYVPELSALRPLTGDPEGPAAAIRLRQLLTHTAGFSYWFYPDDPVAARYADDLAIGDGRWRFDPDLGGLDGLARSLSRLPLVAPPGERWHYSMSLEVAGMVVERASGKTFDAFLRERIFAPLRMASTGFSVTASDSDRLASLYAPGPDGDLRLVESGRDSPLLHPVPGPSGGDGLVSTIDDYARFAEMLRRGGVLDGERVLSADSARAMMTNQLAPGQLAELPGIAAFGLGGTGQDLGFGLGGAVVVHSPANGAPAVTGEYSWGGAASTTFWVDPVNSVTVVAMTQLMSPGTVKLRDKLHSAVYAA